MMPELDLQIVNWLVYLNSIYKFAFQINLAIFLAVETLFEVHMIHFFFIVAIFKKIVRTLSL